MSPVPSSAPPPDPAKECPPAPEECHAWYSAKQEQFHRDDHRTPGCIYWGNNSGTRVEVTMISKNINHGCNTAVLDDLIYRGIVHVYRGICRR